MDPASNSSSSGSAGRREARYYRFARALLLTKDAERLHRLIVHQMARAVGAELGALALYVPSEGALAIVATRGYPSALVAHIRINPGEGVIGKVFASERPVRVQVTPADANVVRQRRYRGDSYMAVPLVGADGTLGVVSVTDAVNREPFTREHLATLRAYAIPAALALSRELLRDRAADLAHLATVDALTGIFNRRYFDERLAQEIQRERRAGIDLSLLMIDIDDFKVLNDARGHLYGDRVLREVAEILRRSVRIFDVCARYGGEEFAILMPGANASTALQIAERIRGQAESHFADSWRFAGAGRPTLSIGISTARAAMTGEALVAGADAALMWAKAAGKNAVKVNADVPPPTTAK
jgi:diguanylate cyclase (GGDEF)-like protein